MKSIPRFFLKEYEFSKGKFYLKDHYSLKHARRVLRLGVGNKIILFDGKGTSHLCEIALLTKEVLTADLISTTHNDLPEKPRIILAQALPKAGKIENILRMNTEVGIYKFVLFESDFSIVKKKHYDDKKIARLNKIIQEASRQSVNNFTPELSESVVFEDVLNINADHKLIMHTSISKNTTVDIKDVKTNIKINDTVLVCIGPEGGFSDSELNEAVDKGFRIINLELPVLRTETAGVVISSYLLI